MTVITTSISEEVILAEERTTEEEKMHILEGSCYILYVHIFFSNIYVNIYIYFYRYVSSIVDY